MKLDRLQEYFTVFCVTIAGVLIGIYCGQLAAEGNMAKLGYIAASIVAMIICLTMKTRIWLLIPLAWDLRTQSYLLPLPFGVRDVFILLTFGTFLVYTALKLVRKKPKHDFLDLLLWINILYLLSVYLRNPVGMLALGNDKIGGRPYYLTIIALMGYWVLSRVTLTVKQGRTVPIAILIGAMLVSTMSIVAYKIPATVPVLSHIYAGVEKSTFDETGQEGDYTQDAAENDGDPDSVEGRIGTLLDFGIVAMAFLCAFYTPMTLFNPLYFVRFCAFMLAWVAILYSGHRIGIVTALLSILVSSYFRKGIMEVFKIVGFFLVPALAALILLQGTLFQLPLVAQRALSVLPGNWNRVAVENAQASTDWRFEMWDRALHGNKYIKDKFLGDGFGVSQKAMDSVRALTNEGKTQEAGMEGQLVTGGFHSGPLTTIRVVGGVGTFLFYIWIIWLSRFAVKLIVSSRNTPFFPIALFFGVGVFVQPFFYTFVFGGFDVELPQTILNAGMLKLIYESIQVYKADQKEAEVIQTTRVRKAMGGFAPVNA
ncbi:MAG: hypothetical protein WCD79_22385 [Chthoniobacteraceae bacterium]